MVVELECIDRVSLNLYQPTLVYPAGVVGFFGGTGRCRSLVRADGPDLQGLRGRDPPVHP